MRAVTLMIVSFPCFLGNTEKNIYSQMFIFGDEFCPVLGDTPIKILIGITLSYAFM